MLKCNKCGADNDDGQKFCSECGEKLVANEQPEAEEPAAVIESEAATEKVCPACGSKNEPGEKFCSECGKPLDTVDAAKPETAQKPETKKEYKNKFVGTVANVKDKTVTFENKHHIIANALVAIMALVIILVSLLAPVKYTKYDAKFLEDMVGGMGGGMNGGMYFASSDYGYGDMDDIGYIGEDEDDKKPRRVEYFEIDQSIFNSIGAVFALTSSALEAAEELQKMQVEFAEAAVKFAGEMVKIEQKFEEKLEKAGTDEKKLEKLEEEMEAEIKKAAGKSFKGINWYKYDVLTYKIEFTDMVAGNLNASGSDNSDSDNSANEAKEKTQAMLNLVSSVVFTLITAVIRIILSIIALVYLIKAILRIVKKEPANNALFNLICTTMGALASCIAIESFSSGLHVGGGSFALMLVCAIVAFVLGSINALVNKVHSPLTVVKNAVVGLFITIGFFLLCTDFISFKTTVEGMNGVKETYTEYGPLGWAMFKGLDAIFEAVGSGSEGGAVSGAVTGMGLTVSGYLITFLFLATICLLGSGVARRLRYNACGVITRKNGTSVKDAYGTRALITGIVFGIISILVTLVGSPALIKGLAEAIEKGSEGAISGFEPTGAFGVRAQVFVSVIFVLIAMIFSKVFKPENFGKKNQNAAENAAA